MRFNGQELLRVTERVSAGDPLRIDPLPGAVVGRNELFLEAAPPIEQGNRAHAVRVRILRDGVTFAEKTFWSEPGSQLLADFSFTIHQEPAATTPLDHVPPEGGAEGTDTLAIHPGIASEGRSQSLL